MIEPQTPTDRSHPLLAVSQKRPERDPLFTKGLAVNALIFSSADDVTAQRCNVRVLDIYVFSAHRMLSPLDVDPRVRPTERVTPASAVVVHAAREAAVELLAIRAALPSSLVTSAGARVESVGAANADEGVRPADHAAFPRGLAGGIRAAIERTQAAHATLTRSAQIPRCARSGFGPTLCRGPSGTGAGRSLCAASTAGV
jgi:hypothetical protein